MPGLIIRRSVVRVHPAHERKPRSAGCFWGAGRRPEDMCPAVVPHRSRGRPRFKTAPWDEPAVRVSLSERWAGSSLAARPGSLLRLGHRQLGRRNRLETLVGDRRSTLDRKAVGSGPEAPLGALDGCELLVQLHASALGELPLDPLPLGHDELTCSIRVHECHPSIPPPEPAGREVEREGWGVRSVESVFRLILPSSLTAERRSGENLGSRARFCCAARGAIQRWAPSVEAKVRGILTRFLPD